VAFGAVAVGQAPGGNAGSRAVDERLRLRDIGRGSALARSDVDTCEVAGDDRASVEATASYVCDR
jgi:hypothetical protein